MASDAAGREPEMVQAWKTSDGEVYATREKAEVHEQWIRDVAASLQRQRQRQESLTSAGFAFGTLVRGPLTLRVGDSVGISLGYGDVRAAIRELDGEVFVQMTHPAQGGYVMGGCTHHIPLTEFLAEWAPLEEGAPDGE